MMFGQVKGPRCVGRPINIWNDIVVSDVRCLNMTHAYRYAQNKPAWQDKTCPKHK